MNELIEQAEKKIADACLEIKKAAIEACNVAMALDAKARQYCPDYQSPFRSKTESVSKSSTDITSSHCRSKRTVKQIIMDTLSTNGDESKNVSEISVSSGLDKKSIATTVYMLKTTKENVDDYHISEIPKDEEHKHLRYVKVKINH